MRPSEITEKKYHLSCPYQSDVFNLPQSSKQEKLNARAVIIPHHLLAANLIHETLYKIDPASIKTIILIGPNHANLDLAPIQTSLYPWKTQFGLVEAEMKLTNRLIGEKISANNEDIFNTEHSVCGLVTFIKKYFPSANIIPLVMKSNTAETDSLMLARVLSACNNCLVIVSSDFSHEVDAETAKKQDHISMEILANPNVETVDRITSDSIPALRTLFYFLQFDNSNYRTILHNSNSFEISGENPESVTSYITVFYSK